MGLEVALVRVQGFLLGLAYCLLISFEISFPRFIDYVVINKAFGNECPLPN